MSFDFDSQAFWQWLFGGLSLGAGGYKVVTHEMRIAQLESHRKEIVDPQLKVLSDSVSGIERQLEEVAGGVNSIRDILMKKGAD